MCSLRESGECCCCALGQWASIETAPKKERSVGLNENVGMAHKALPTAVDVSRKS